LFQRACSSIGLRTNISTTQRCHVSCWESW
jgi:hypothetical protein